MSSFVPTFSTLYKVYIITRVIESQGTNNEGFPAFNCLFFISVSVNTLPVSIELVNLTFVTWDIGVQLSRCPLDCCLSDVLEEDFFIGYICLPYFICTGILVQHTKLVQQIYNNCTTY